MLAPTQRRMGGNHVVLAALAKIMLPKNDRPVHPGANYYPIKVSVRGEVLLVNNQSHPPHNNNHLKKMPVNVTVPNNYPIDDGN